VEGPSGKKTNIPRRPRKLAGPVPSLWWNENVHLDITFPDPVPANFYRVRAEAVIQEWQTASDHLMTAIRNDPCSTTYKPAQARLSRRQPIRLDSSATTIDARMVSAKHITLPLKFQEIADGRNIPSHQEKDKTPGFDALVEAWDVAVEQLEYVAVEQLESHTGTVMIKSKDSIELLWKLHQGLDLNERLQMEEAVQGYMTGWDDHTKAGLAGTTDNDKRHYHAELAIKERGKFDLGVFHLAYWFASQHTSDGPLISGEQAGGSLKFKLAQEFHCRAHTLFERTTNMTRYLAPSIYDSYKLSMDLLAEHHPDFKAVYGDSASCFVGAAIVRNHRVIPHHNSVTTRTELFA
jgi:hypothetical protein